MKTSTVGIILAGLFLVFPDIGKGGERTEFAPARKRNAFIFTIGAAAAKPYDAYWYTSTVSLIYQRKFRRIFGYHVEAGAGLSENYTAIAGQLDAWIHDCLRIGIGFGSTPFIEAYAKSNPILIPFPEASIGCQLQGGVLTYSASMTGNMIYGARASAGLGYAN